MSTSLSLQHCIRGLFLALWATLIASCAGYRVGDGDRQIPGGYRTVAIPVFQNKSLEAGIETFFTNALVREFQRGRVGRVTSKSDAQTTLEGSVESVKYTVNSQVNKALGAAYLPENTVYNSDYTILVALSLKLRRNSDQKILWEGNFSGERTYLAPAIGIEGVNSANATYNQSARYQNIESMASELMNEAHNRITENF